jgi:recombinational DNA repair protein (RecF pathway)
MQEYLTKAVVLQKDLRNDADARYSFFTERFGKIAARAKSSRKIVSKLAGHLEPGTLASVRIIEIHGAQVVDALKISRVGIPLAELSKLNNLLGEWEPEPALWAELASAGADADGSVAYSVPNHFSWARALAVLGWDPEGAECVLCGTSPARYFHLPRQEFICARCASNFRQNEIVLV